VGKCLGIGYQGQSLAGLCEELRTLRVDLVIDVRERAWSNRPEFRKGVLSRALAEHGIKYQHMREAGNPFRPKAGEQIDAAECVRRYQQHLRSRPDVVIAIRRLSRRRRVALLCYEADSAACHRGVLLAQL
jgi:uncharacterized protein (DUF488 family)